MRFDNDDESVNIEDRRDENYTSGYGGFPLGGRSLGIGTLVMVLAAMYFGIDPLALLQDTPPANRTPQRHSAYEEKLAHFVGQVLADTEKSWHQIFDAAGRQYIEPKLVLFRHATPTACGTGETAMGPFYCPADQKVYIDLDFYDALQKRFHAPGDFAQAYVIAHEVGHHVQNLIGISGKVQRLRDHATQKQGNALSVRLELQADCFAGVWAHHADQSRQILEPGDIEEALAAAAAIGDDTLQRQTQGQVVPETFTHGSAQQRAHWFKQGFQYGTIEACNTFSKRSH